MITNADYLPPVNAQNITGLFLKSNRYKENHLPREHFLIVDHSTI